MTVVIVIALVELALLMLAVNAVVRTWRRYQRHRVEVPEFWMALEDALASQIGATASRLVLGEAKIWVGLIVWLLRRGRAPKSGSFAYTAASQLGLIVVVVLFLVALEGGVSGLLIPLPWLKVLLFAVSAHAAIWIAGIYGSLRAYPHVITEHGLLVRYGVLADGWIPLDGPRRDLSAKADISGRSRWSFHRRRDGDLRSRRKNHSDNPTTARWSRRWLSSAT